MEISDDEQDTNSFVTLQQDPNVTSDDSEPNNDESGDDSAQEDLATDITLASQQDTSATSDEIEPNDDENPIDRDQQNLSHSAITFRIGRMKESHPAPFHFMLKRSDEKN